MSEQKIIESVPNEQRMTLREAKELLGLPSFVHALNDGGHRLIGSKEAVEHFIKLLSANTPLDK